MQSEMCQFLSSSKLNFAVLFTPELGFPLTWPAYGHYHSVILGFQIEERHVRIAWAASGSVDSHALAGNQFGNQRLVVLRLARRSDMVVQIYRRGFGQACQFVLGQAGVNRIDTLNYWCIAFPCILKE